MHCYRKFLVRICCGLALFSSPVFASSFMNEAFIDPTDGQLDMSNWLLEKQGFLPTPIIITEPAVGYGGGVALVYFHDKFSGENGKPSVSAVIGGGTENGTWFVGGGHLGIWDNDRIRYVAAAGKADINIQYYGRFADNEYLPSVELNANSAFLLQKIQFRIADSNFFAGASYTFIDTGNKFSLKDSELLPGELISFDSRSASLAAIVTYDSRDNIFTPNRGIESSLKLASANSAWGGDNDYLHYDFSLLYYNDFATNWVAGTRFIMTGVEADDAPYYAFPYIDMRGIKAMQYQGDLVSQGELELRWSFTKRWTLVGFGGVARAFNNQTNKNDSDVIYSKGAGIRYLIASKLGLQFGIDVAQGPDDTAMYFQVGSGWSI